MSLPVDLLASLAMGAFCGLLLAAHRIAGAPRGYQRVKQQGSTFFLGPSLMHAGYWMLQPAVRGCTKTSTPPAVISWLSLVPAVASAIAGATGHWGWAAWCLLASALLDVLDGAVARALGEMSPGGAVLDSVLDRYAEFIFFAGAMIYYRYSLAAQLIVLAALLGSFLVTYSTAKAEALQVTPPRGSMKRSDRLAVLIAGTAAAPLSIYWFEASDRVIAWPVLIAMGVIALFANVSAVRRFVALAREADRKSRRTKTSP
ncbi:MAG: CDP-alcohol phosphatidyltransferase family protein [Opitutus sp.]